MFLAYALLSVIIYQHNSHSKVNNKVVLRPNEAEQFSDDLRVRQNAIGIIPKLNKCFSECELWEIDLSDKEIDLEMTATVYLASLKKFVILSTLQSAISKIMLNTISLFTQDFRM